MTLADANGDGTLNRKELFDFFSQIDGITHNDQIIGRIFSDVDEDNDGEIDEAEFA